MTEAEVSYQHSRIAKYNGYIRKWKAKNKDKVKKYRQIYRQRIGEEEYLRRHRENMRRSRSNKKLLLAKQVCEELGFKRESTLNDGYVTDPVTKEREWHPLIRDQGPLGLVMVEKLIKLECDGGAP